MRWCVIRHPDVADAGLIAEDSLEHYEARGWTRVSDWSTDHTLLRPADFPAPTETTPEAQPAKSAKSSSKESS